MIKTFLFFIVLLSLAYLCFHSFFVVNERDQAAILGFGKVVGVRSQPGLYFKLPFAFLGADRIRRFEDRSLRLELAEIRVHVAGGKFCRVNAFVIYKIRDPALFLQSVSGNVAVAEIRLLTRLDSGLREVYGRYGFEAALSSARRTMMTQVKSELEPQAWTLGLAIVDVRIERTDLTDPVLEKAFDRMEAKRFAVAERIRASDREAATRRWSTRQTAAPPAPQPPQPQYQRQTPPPAEAPRQLAQSAPLPAARPGGVQLYSLHREYGLTPDAIPAPPQGPNYILVGPPDAPPEPRRPSSGTRDPCS